MYSLSVGRLTLIKSSSYNFSPGLSPVYLISISPSGLSLSTGFKITKISFDSTNSLIHELEPPYQVKKIPEQIQLIG